MKFNTDKGAEYISKFEGNPDIPTLAMYCHAMGTTRKKLCAALEDNTALPRDILDTQLNWIEARLELLMLTKGSVVAYNHLKRPPFNWHDGTEPVAPVSMEMQARLAKLDAVLFGHPGKRGEEGDRGEFFKPTSPNRNEKSTLPN